MIFHCPLQTIHNLWKYSLMPFTVPREIANFIKLLFFMSLSFLIDWLPLNNVSIAILSWVFPVFFLARSLTTLFLGVSIVLWFLIMCFGYKSIHFKYNSGILVPIKKPSKPARAGLEVGISGHHFSLPHNIDFTHWLTIRCSLFHPLTYSNLIFLA